MSVVLLGGETAASPLEAGGLCWSACFPRHRCWSPEKVECEELSASEMLRCACASAVLPAVALIR